MRFDQVRVMGGRRIPTRVEVTPTGKPGHRTVMRYLEMQFNANVRRAPSACSALNGTGKESGDALEHAAPGMAQPGPQPQAHWLALAAIGLGQFALLAMSGITGGYTDAMLETITGPMVGHVQIHAPGWRDEQSLELSVTALAARLDALRENPGVARASARIYAPALVAVTRDAQAAIVLGIDPEAESGPKGLLATAPEGARPGEYRVLVGRALAQSLGVTPGSELAVVGQGKDGSIANDLYTVAGVLPAPSIW